MLYTEYPLNRRAIALSSFHGGTTRGNRRARGRAPWKNASRHPIHRWEANLAEFGQRRAKLERQQAELTAAQALGMKLERLMVQSARKAGRMAVGSVRFSTSTWPTRRFPERARSHPHTGGDVDPGVADRFQVRTDAGTTTGLGDEFAAPHDGLPARN
ncbi:MAG: hypothetical protein LBB76_05970 [Azoarcus sp.]|jgi:hypothetical protein|nr:hypothetical protein [Azoarcus sp.]